MLSAGVNIPETTNSSSFIMYLVIKKCITPFSIHVVDRVMHNDKTCFII
jgi:hypothetical protein